MGATANPATIERMATVRLTAALLVVAAFAGMVTDRLPQAFRDLSGAATANAGRDEGDGALAAADSVDMDNGFVRAAMQTVPRGSRFLVETASTEQAAGYKVDPATLWAVPGQMVEDLLPSRPATEPRVGIYVICYLCDTSPWDKRVDWLWNNHAGMAIGRITR